MNPVRRTLFIVSVLSLPLGGCSILDGWFGKNETEYRTLGQRTVVRSLEVPPDLTKPVADDRFVVPDNRTPTTFSQYSRDRGNAPQPVNAGVLPKFEKARIERNGDQHWLVVRATPDRVWPVVKEFWQETGFVLKRETPEAGIMETEWAENRSKIPQDAIRNTVGRLLDGLYSSGERDKFRTRIDNGTESGTTEIFISHRGIEEIYTNPDKNSTGWQFRPSDKDLEAEMLGRLMVKFGLATDRTTAVAAAVPANTMARAAYDKQSGGTLQVQEAFDRAWRRVGLALDRSGFTVEDRDRSKGMYFVRYADPDVDIKSGEKKGWLDRLAFWRSDKPADPQQYRLRVVESGNATNVDVVLADGKVDGSPTAKRILTLLFDQLR